MNVGLPSHPDNIIDGTFGARLEIATDTNGYTKLTGFRFRLITPVTIGASATVVVWSFDCNAEGFIAANSRFYFSTDCILTWASGGVPGARSAKASGVAAATAVLDTNPVYPTATGTDTDTTPAWDTDGGSVVRYKITNNRAQTLTVGGFADGIVYTI